VPEEGDMTTPVSLDAVVAFWAAHLGCRDVQLARPGASVVRNGPDPANRGRGHGKAVVSTMTTHGLALGGVVHYRTLEANLAPIGHRPVAGFPAVRPDPGHPPRPPR
jgi:hypothetical protein